MPHRPDHVLIDVDDRRTHPWTLLYLLGMRLHRDKTAFEGAEHTRRVALGRQRAGDAPPTRRTRRRAVVRDLDRAGLEGWRVAPRRAPAAATVLYLHGGGYVHPLTPDYWRLVRALLRAPAEVVVPAYALAPAAQVDDVLPRLVDLAADLLGEGRPVVLMGDSAGGALVLEVARGIRDRSPSGPAPVAVVPLCPWLDATLADDEVADLEATDPMLAESGLRAAGRWWAGPRGADDPLVSPVHLDLDDLPPIDVWIGDRDILRPAVDRLVERARGARVELHVHEVTAMFHVWMTRAVPEAFRTRRDLVDLVRQRAGRQRAER